MFKRILLLLLILFFSFSLVCATSLEDNDTHIKFTYKDKVAYATIVPNPTSDDFIDSLPLNLTFNEIWGTEKYASMPNLLVESKHHNVLKEGYVVYYPLTNSLAVCYHRDDGSMMGSKILIAKIDSGLDLFRSNNLRDVMIEVVE
ncbi:MAG: hypothetical protein IJJ47_06500 [Methanosphaera sp.]|nr:hypothetical protein [Methanosphaera sp.]